jgi:hypothetical protein
MHTATKIPIMYSFSGNIASFSPNFNIHVSVSDLYSPRIGLHISSSRIGRPIVGINNSLTDAWMWKLGLRSRYSFSGNICFEISVFCLCSAEQKLTRQDHISPKSILFYAEQKLTKIGVKLWRRKQPFLVELTYSTGNKSLFDSGSLSSLRNTAFSIRGFFPQIGRIWREFSQLPSLLFGRHNAAIIGGLNLIPAWGNMFLFLGCFNRG